MNYKMVGINKIKEFSLLHFLCMAIAFCFILFPKLVPAIIYLMFLSVFFEGNIKQRITQIKFDTFSISMICFFMLHVVGLFYSDNIGFGLMDMEIKLPFLLVPIIFSLTNKKIDPIQFNLFFKVYTLSALIYIVYCFIHAFQDFEYYKVAHELPAEYIDSVSVFKYFTKYYLSPFHTTYMSMHYCLLFCYWSIYSFSSKNKWKTAVSFCIVTLFFIFILLLYSKAGIITLLLLIVLLLTYYIITYKKYMRVVFLLALFAGIVFYSIKLLPDMQLRINSVLGIAKNSDVKVGEESTQRRVYAWKASLEIIKENFILGVGTGDIKDELLKQYLKQNWLENYAYKLNSHNQYLQTFAALGAIGFLSLIFALLILVYQSIRRKKLLLLLFSVILIINAAFESIIEIQTGVVFFTFLSVFLIHCFNKHVTI